MGAVDELIEIALDYTHPRWPNPPRMDPMNEVKLLTPDEREALRAKLSRIAQDPDVKPVYRLGAVFYGLALDLVKRADGAISSPGSGGDQT